MFGGFKLFRHLKDANCAILPPVSRSECGAKHHFSAFMHVQLASAHFCTIFLALSRFDDRVQVSLSDAYSHFRLASSRFCTISLALVHNKAPMKCPLIHTFYSLLHTYYRLMRALVQPACQPNVRFCTLKARFCTFLHAFILHAFRNCG